MCTNYHKLVDCLKGHTSFVFRYSPVHNVKTHDSHQYPTILLLTADHDDRVVPLHSFKMIAELQYVLGQNKNQVSYGGNQVFLVSYFVTLLLNGQHCHPLISF